jgi:hypothetical protein
VTRLIRFRFSLATLLIAMAWSGVAVWVAIFEDDPARPPPHVTLKHLSGHARRVQHALESVCGHRLTRNTCSCDRWHPSFPSSGHFDAFHAFP